MKSPADIPIRIGDAHDRDILFDAWRKTFRDAPGYAQSSDEDYFPAMGARIEKLLEASDVLVATHSDDPTRCMGFVVVEGPAVHYLFVRARVQGIGIGRALIEAANKIDQPLTVFTHWSRTLREPSTRIFRGLRYNPFRGLTT